MPVDPIAVVGLACFYPGAREPRQFWENILSRRREFRRMPDQRLPLADYYDPNPAAPDKTYGRRGAFIDGFSFDWVGMRIPRQTYESTDVVHWLSLDTATRALKDAGYDRTNVPTDRTGVIVGNSLTGEHTRAVAMRSRWPFVRRALLAAATARGLSANLQEELATTMEDYFKSVFAPVTDDTLAGGLSNTIAGRICNFYDLHGGGYTVDGACASSMLSVITAAEHLNSRNLDLALAGGVDISLDTFELVGFAKVGALSKDDMNVYDRRAAGFLPGEGCGFVVLKRLEDARRAGDTVYAVLRGWGVSSDGKGGIMTPTRAGQTTALLRAYDKAGYGAHDLDFVEGHGTGTTVGDKVELEAITDAVEAKGKVAERRCGVTSLKSIVGHCKAAAGIGAFIKAAMAVNRRVLPPTAGCTQPNAVFETTSRSLYPMMLGEIADPSRCLRAGVSGMGFGGINAHVTLESGDAPSPKLAPTVEERALLVSNQDSEIFVVAAGSISELLGLLPQLAQAAELASISDLTDLAAQLARDLSPSGRVRAAVVAANPDALALRLRELERVLRETPPKEGTVYVSPDREIWFGNGVTGKRLGFLFPGQGSQQLLMGRTLVERHAWARRLVETVDVSVEAAGSPAVSGRVYRRTDRASEAEREGWARELAQTEVAQPAICLASLLYARHLQNLGLRPTVVGGHSLGELTAFHIAGAFDERALFQLAAMRGRAMAAEQGGTRGTMASLTCGREEAEALVKRATGYAVLANRNAPTQFVVSGEEQAVLQVIKLAAEEGIATRRLPVSNAFHSRLVEEAARTLRAQAPVPERLGPISTELISSMTTDRVEPGLPLREHFGAQVLAPVDFIGLVERMQRSCDLLIEVGPARVLSTLASEIAGPQTLCLPVASSPSTDRDLNLVLAAVFAHGVDVSWGALYEGRLTRPFQSAQARVFVDNPCERPFRPTGTWATGTVPATAGALEIAFADAAGVSADQMKGYLAKRAGFLADVVKADLASLDGTPSIGATTNTAAAKVAPREVSAAAPPAPAPAASAPAGAQALLLELAAQRTGFPRESLALEMSLLDDLSLDSIKAGGLVAAAAKQLGVAGKLDPSRFARSTLGDVAAALTDAAGAGGGASAAAPPAPERATVEAAGAAHPSEVELTHAASAERVVREEVARLTGFPVGTIDLEMRTSDLSLDQDRVRKVLHAVTAALRVDMSIDPEPLMGRSLRDILAVCQRLIRKHAQAANRALPEVSDAGPAWVRNFGIRWVAEPAARRQSSQEVRTEDDWSKAAVLIVADQVEFDLAEALANRLSAAGAIYRIATYDEAGRDGLVQLPDASHLVAILPRGWASRTGEESARLRGSLWRLQTFAAPASAEAGSRRRTTVAFVQFGGGRFGQGASPAHPEVCCATSFARSLHLERSDLRVRVIDLSTAIDPAPAAERIVDEINGSDAFGAVGYDADLVRVVPRAELHQPFAYRRRAISWGPNDVFLVTGGAKGITAECALALAKSTGAKFALVGSSALGQGAGGTEVGRTLERFQAARVTVRYYPCDLTDRDAVFEMVRQVRAELGPITGVVHGAGVNRPRLVGSVSVDEAYAEVAPKLLGAHHLCAALASSPPRLLVALTSIIGVTGMPGNAWYAFSNEALDLVVRRFGVDHPETSVQSVAYSVWSEVGMGARLGAVEALARMRIGAIPPDEGISRFLRLFECDPGDQQVIVTARLGGLDTWPAPPSPVPDLSRDGMRFIEEVVEHIPDVHLIARAHLTFERDRYVQDHIYRDSPLFPTVFGLEAMTQACAKLLGVPELDVARIEDLRLDRPIVVDSNEGIDIELRAELLEDDAQGERRVRVGIRAESTGFAIDHFSAVFVLGQHPAEAPGERPPQTGSLDLDPRRDLYGGLLFQGPLFQRMGEVLHLDSGKVVFATEARSAAELGETGFQPGQGGRYFLGDPYFRDVLLQSVQLVIPQHNDLPLRIERIELHARPGSTGGPRIVTGVLLSSNAEEDVHEVVARDAEGRVTERLTGYHARILRLEPDQPTAEELAAPGPFDERTLRRRVEAGLESVGLAAPRIALEHAPGLERLPVEARHDRELPVIARSVGATGPVAVEWSKDGRPRLRDGSQAISLSHDERYLLCVAGSTPQGCDLAPVTHRSQEDWSGLLLSSGMSVVNELARLGDSQDRGGTRVWAAVEAVKKATGSDAVSLTILRHAKDVVVFTANVGGEVHQVATLPFRMQRGPERIVALVAAEHGATGTSSTSARDALGVDAIDPEAYRVHYSYDGPQGQFVQETRLIVPFRDSTGPSRHVSFAKYVAWMGKIRELALSSQAARMIQDFQTGEFGMVTNFAEIEIRGEATALDVVESRIWNDSINGPVGDLGFEFVKVGANGSERLALGKQQVTWVRIVGHGLVEPAPLPPYMADYFERMRPKGNQPYRLRPLPEALGGQSRGVELPGPDGPGRGKLLRTETFLTSSEDSNVVGNIYYANYFAWQARALDMFLFSVAPRYLRDVSDGEVLCAKSRVDYLREAMPFDRIEVAMFAEKVFERGATLRFEYFRSPEGGPKEKLSVGHLDVLWGRRGDRGVPKAAPWPADLRAALSASGA